MAMMGIIRIHPNRMPPTMITRIMLCSLMFVEATPWMNNLPLLTRRIPFQERNTQNIYKKNWNCASSFGLKQSSVPAETHTSLANTEVADSSDQVEILADDGVFLKPERDGRQYRMIRLKQNNLKVLLVSDQLPEGDVGVEAASVHVQAGHFDDTIPGLAHFHEHVRGSLT